MKLVFINHVYVMTMLITRMIIIITNHKVGETLFMTAGHGDLEQAKNLATSRTLRRSGSRPNSWLQVAQRLLSRRLPQHPAAVSIVVIISSHQRQATCSVCLRLHTPRRKAGQGGQRAGVGLARLWSHVFFWGGGGGTVCMGWLGGPIWGGGLGLGRGF